MSATHDTEDTGEGEGAQPTASGSVWTKLSEFFPYGDGPPRLCAGLNDTLTDASPAAVFALASKVVKQRGKPDAPASPMEMPLEDKVADPYQADVVHDVLDWIAYRLDLGASAAWISQIAQMLEWSPNGGPEEGWAQAISEMFLGVTYSGPGPTYNFGAPLKRDDEGALVKNGGNDTVAWERMIFRRIERKQWQKSGDRFGLQSWENPIPFEQDADVANTDPAISIGTACQHLSTYAVVTRGIALDSMGNGTVPAVGLMASDANWGAPLFGGPGYDKPPLGSSEKLAGYHLPKPKPKPKPGEAETPPLPEETVAYYLDAKHAMEAGLAPGSIAIYDTDRGTERAPPQIYMTEYERNKHGPDNVKIYGTYFKTRSSNEDVSGFSSSWTNADRPIGEAAADAAGYKAQIATIEAKEKKTKTDESRLTLLNKKLAEVEGKRETDKAPRQAVPYPGPRQYPGAHIYAVLRTHPTKPLVQLIDVNLSDNRSTLEATGSESIMFEQTEGVVDGSGRTRLYDMNNAFGGLGVLPPHSLDQAQVDFLRTARPVGLGRVAITKRLASAMRMTDDDVLYVSRATRLYGDDPGKSYTVSRLLWSLRNTPGFTDVQVWWFVYAPRGLLAKAMWAHGARKMRLTDFVAKHHDLGADDMLLAIVVTNLGAPPRAGHVTLYCRYKSRPDGKTTVTEFLPHPPPSALMRYVDPGGLRKYDPTKRSLKWDESHAHAKISLEESRLPAIFQAGG